MPVFPKPTGPHAVGTVCCRLTDKDRMTHLASETPGRDLFVRLWYPAAAGGGTGESLWADLRGAPGLPVPLRLLLAYLGKVQGHARRDAPFAGAAEPPSLIVYSHGLLSFAAENTSLVEDLASHGHIVMALQHMEQMAELQALNRTRTASERKADRAMAKAIKAASPAARADMGPGYYAGAHITNRIVAARAADIGYALDRVEALLGVIPGFAGRVAPAQPIGLAGFSVGGAVSGAFARASERPCAVANIDGGLFGPQQDAPWPDMPYLMLQSAVSEGLNDALLPSSARRLALPGTTHLNFHDIAMLLPVLRWFGAAGKADARATIARRNAEVRAVFADPSG